jgi:Mn2+/Fe2+ NRAMP family transporter
MFLAFREIRRARWRFVLLTGAVGLLVFLILFVQALSGALIGQFIGAIKHQSADVLVYSVLILSQVILSLQLPFAVVPLVRFTGQRSKMGQFVNPRALSAGAWAVAAVIIALNAWLLVGVFHEWLA